MAEKKPACSSAMSTATSPTGIDADKGNCGRPSGERLVCWFGGKNGGRRVKGKEYGAHPG